MGVARVLVADDDHEIVNLIADALEDEGYETIKAYNGRDAATWAVHEDVGLIILDIMMPEMDGLEVCRRIRDTVSVPIILLTAKGREMDKIVGLEIGADDYMTKPFSVNELVARVKAHLRRERRSVAMEREMAQILQTDGLRINLDTYEVHRGEVRIELSTREFQLLAYMVQNRSRVLSREQIYRAVWGDNEYGDLNTVTVHIRNLRTKLDEENRLIKTVWGVGYRFVGGLG